MLLETVRHPALSILTEEIELQREKKEDVEENKKIMKNRKKLKFIIDIKNLLCVKYILGDNINYLTYS